MATLNHQQDKSSLLERKGCPPVKKVDLNEKNRNEATWASFWRFLKEILYLKVAFCLYLAPSTLKLVLLTIISGQIKLFLKTWNYLMKLQTFFLYKSWLQTFNSNHRAKRGGSLFEVAFGEAQRRSPPFATLLLWSCLIFWNFLTKIAGGGV